LLKDLTGGERVRADRKYEHETEFDPTEKLWLYGNHKPIVADSTKAMWRRVRLIPFTVTIPDDEIDNTLRDKLSHELPAVLAWAVKGCMDWQLLGFDIPETVKRATQSYREEEDILRDYIEACLEIKPSGRTPKKSLWSNYKEWCDENKVMPVSRARLSSLLVERGITDGKSGSVRYWAGMEIIGSPGSEEALPLEQEKAEQLGQLGQNRGNIPKTLYAMDSKGNFREHPPVASQKSQNDSWDGMPDYPHEPCYACGGTDFWPDFKNKRFVCQRCHPKPQEIDMEA
jgi:putative DNA primase/helicase